LGSEGCGLAAAGVGKRFESEGEVGGRVKTLGRALLHAAMHDALQGGRNGRRELRKFGGSSFRMADIVSADVGLRKARLPESIS
jgi:hypothetical protein